MSAEERIIRALSQGKGVSLSAIEVSRLVRDYPEISQNADLHAITARMFKRHDRQVARREAIGGQR